jgi:hypothetical protein
MDNINTKKLNNTIDEIVKEAKTLKSVVEMQKEIASTKIDIKNSSANIEKILAEETKNLKMLGELIKDNYSFIQSVNIYHEKTKQQNELFQKEIISLIEKQGNDFKDEYNKLNVSNNELNKKLSIALEAKFEEIQKQNKEFQKELDGSIFTRLEKHKSDIQIEIRNEGTQIQRAFENTITNQFNNFESKQNVKFETISKNQKKNNSYSIINLTILIVILIILTIKTFVIK